MMPDAALSPSSLSAFVRFRDRVRARTGSAELLAFRLGDERFAFDVRALDEAVDQPHVEMTPVNGAAILVGLMRHADRSIPVFDTARVLGVRRDTLAAVDAPSQVLVMRSGARRIALLVDAIDDVVTLELTTIQPPPFDAGDELLIGVTWNGEDGDLTAILDARALIVHCQQRAPEVAG
ncbi:MAG: chemotaxis protein CheW [Gemmatimonadaceae bacterium]|nr:chemotaxis protein CheW [Gemmatimonadaceae bacterium]